MISSARQLSNTGQIMSCLQLCCSDRLQVDVYFIVRKMQCSLYGRHCSWYAHSAPISKQETWRSQTKRSSAEAAIKTEGGYDKYNRAYRWSPLKLDDVASGGYLLPLWQAQDELVVVCYYN